MEELSLKIHITLGKKEKQSAMNCLAVNQIITLSNTCSKIGRPGRINIPLNQSPSLTDQSTNTLLTPFTL